jgi:coproporphyrinogen III oxidase-like Fe-S oxidoreductase
MTRITGGMTSNVFRSTEAENSIWSEFKQNSSQYRDVTDILSQYERSRKYFQNLRRSLPLPVWRQRGYEQDGKEAWHHLCKKVSNDKAQQAISIYIHIPFCDRRCNFCDCYSLPIGKLAPHTISTYIGVLLREMDLWKNILNIDKRPVTTVHLGGGTPNCIDISLFELLLKQCRRCFNITTETELALESTSSLLTQEHFKELKKLGFSRLHVGVQTLDDDIRCLIGRRERADTVVVKLAQALEEGFIVSVDIILGLPKQTISGFLNTVQKLRNIGIHGFSFYQLQISKHNRRFIKRTKTRHHQPLFEYLLFQIGEQELDFHNYRKNHFDHFALPKDRNLYSRHMLRGEDLLALGATADGVFDHYHYRHPKLRSYIKNDIGEMPILEGGMYDSTLEEKVRPGVIAIMTGHIPLDVFKNLKAERLLNYWRKCALIRENAHGKSYRLTANGSWYVNNMIDQLSEFVSPER